jgi:hypothetical protein
MAWYDHLRPSTDGDLAPDASADSDEADDASADTDTGTAEQLAAGDPAPRGEDRETEHGPDGNLAALLRHFTGRSGSRLYRDAEGTNADTDTIVTDVSHPPPHMAEWWREYYKEYSLTRAGLFIFGLSVAEPGYRLTATRTTTDDEGEETTERDDDMTDALEAWASQCAIHAGKKNRDFGLILRDAPAFTLGKGTAMIEKVGAEGDPDRLRSLVFQKPETFKQYRRENKPLLVQPGDDVDDDHPRTPETDTDPEGKAAAYVQYDDDLDGFDDEDSIAFAEDEILKLTWDADEGDLWGTSVFAACHTHIDALRKEFRDRDGAIELAGYPHRIYSSDGWTQDEANDWAKAHEEGETGATEGDGTSTGEDDGYDNPFSARVDFIGGADLDVTVVEGSVPDIGDAVMDHIQHIFAAIPVSKLFIAYEESINQFVAEPQTEKDNRIVDQFRRHLEREFTPVFEQVADQLADGEEYDGEVELRIEPKEAANPLERDNFPVENLGATTDLIREAAKAGADPELISALVRGTAEYAGFSIDQLHEEHGETLMPEDLAPEIVDSDGSQPSNQDEAGGEE